MKIISWLICLGCSLSVDSNIIPVYILQREHPEIVVGWAVWAGGVDNSRHLAVTYL